MYPLFTSTFIYFGSNTKYRELSNFFECSIEYNGLIYPSVEHVYASLKFIESDRHRFTITGDLGQYNAFIVYGHIFYKAGDSFIQKQKYWSTRQCIGIIAKMASSPNNVKKLGLTFVPELSLQQKVDLFYKLLLIKFRQPLFLNILRGTGDAELVELSNRAQMHERKGVVVEWCGYVSSGVVYGNNRMGKILMKVREALVF